MRMAPVVNNPAFISVAAICLHHASKLSCFSYIAAKQLFMQIIFRNIYFIATFKNIVRRLNITFCGRITAKCFNIQCLYADGKILVTHNTHHFTDCITDNGRVRPP